MPPVISRRSLLRRLVSTSALGAASAGGAFGYGNLLERHWIQVIRRDVFLPNLPEEMDGFKIAQLSDLHLEPWTTAEDIADAVKLTNSLLPDLIVITGDFVTHTVKPAGRLAEVLAGLEAPHGVLGCVGNHDVWNQPSILSRFMAERQIEILRNEGLRLHTPKGALFIAGLDSAWAGKPDVSPALRDWKPAEPLLILAHEPDTADHVARSSLPALQLSGHTHGGQVCFPSFSPIALHLPFWGKKYGHGHYQIGKLQLYVNRGIGCVGLPIRFACPPEVTEITLRFCPPGREEAPTVQA